MGVGLTKDLVDDAHDRLGGIDGDAARCVLSRLMQANGEFAFGWLCPPLIFWSLVQPSNQCGFVDSQDEHSVEQVNERSEVSRTAAEEGHRLVAVGDQSFHGDYAPNVVLVPVVFVGSPVSGSPWYASSVSPLMAWWPRRCNSLHTVVLPLHEAPSIRKLLLPTGAP
jgi:hypothetical protein